MAFGLTSTGFEKKRLADIKIEIEDTLRSLLGNQINLLPESVFGQLVGIYAEREALIWELAEGVYNSQYPDTASGISLDNVAALTGITRQDALKSTLDGVLLFGTPGTIVPAGTVFSVAGNLTAKFVTETSVTLVTGVDEVQRVQFSAVPTSGNFKLQLNDEVTANIPFGATATDVQNALNSLSQLSAVSVTGNFTIGFTINFVGVDGKQNQTTLIVDSNTLQNGVTPVTTTVSTLTAGVPQGSVDCTAQDFGPVQANARTLTVIDTPVSGLSAVKNPSDADLGRFEETDLELRQRRATTLQVAGAGTVEAIRSRLLNLSGVTAAIVFENDTLVTDLDGRPAKSFEAIVQGGVDQEIADLIWATKPAGIQTYGSIMTNITDSQGIVRVINWSRPTNVNIYVEVDLTVDLDFPANGIAASQQALVDMGNSFGIGKDVIVIPKLICALADIPGIVDVVIRVGTAPGPTLDSNIPIDANEISVFDTSRTTVAVI